MPATAMFNSILNFGRVSGTRNRPPDLSGTRRTSIKAVIIEIRVIDRQSNVRRSNLVGVLLGEGFHVNLPPLDDQHLGQPMAPFARLARPRPAHPTVHRQNIVDYRRTTGIHHVPLSTATPQRPPYPLVLDASRRPTVADPT